MGNAVTCIPLLMDLRTHATKYFPYGNLFKGLHMVCFMHGLSTYELEKICNHAQFFIISYGSFFSSI